MTSKFVLKNIVGFTFKLTKVICVLIPETSDNIH